MKLDVQCAAAAQAPLVGVVEEGQADDDETDSLVVNESTTGRHRPSEGTGQGALVRNILEAEKALQVRTSLQVAAMAMSGGTFDHIELHLLHKGHCVRCLVCLCFQCLPAGPTAQFGLGAPVVSRTVVNEQLLCISQSCTSMATGTTVHSSSIESHIAALQ